MEYLGTLFESHGARAEAGEDWFVVDGENYDAKRINHLLKRPLIG